MAKLFFHEFSAPCDVVRFQCMYFGIELEEIKVEFKNLDSLLPKTDFPPRIPLLRLSSGEVITESRVIYQYLESKLNKEKDCLYVDSWGAFIECHIIPFLDRVLWEKVTTDNEHVNIWESFSEIKRDFQTVEKKLSVDRFLSGLEPRYPDFLLLSRLFYFNILESQSLLYPCVINWVENMISTSKNRKFFCDNKETYLEQINKLNGDNIPSS